MASDQRWPELQYVFLLRTHPLFAIHISRNTSMGLKYLATEWNGRGGKASYPNQNTPRDPLSFTDFNLAGCAQEGDDDAKLKGFQEFPIIPGGNAWQGGDVKPGNDRILFQYIDDTTAAYCGIMTHTTNDKGIPTGKFRLCDDPENAQAQPPYAPGTCSLHLTQRDYSETAEAEGYPRYDVEVHIFDNDKTEIGRLDPTGCDGKNPVTVSSALEDDLVVKAESQNDYVAFTLANQVWPSNGEFGNGDTHNQCSVGGWDATYLPASRQIDCSFLCGWSGGESSANLESVEG